MNELPAELLHGEWPCQREIDLLKRTQEAHQQLTNRLQRMTRELRGERFYPRQTETKQLRVRVYHTYVPPVEGAEGTPAAPGKWTLRIEGVDSSMGQPSVVKFSSYFRKASIELDPHVYSDHVIEWTSFQKTSHDVDGLEISRTGSAAHTVRIKLLPAQAPERFTISPELESAIGQYLGSAKAFNKQDIVLAMWEYIKLRNLIKEDDCRVVVCDERLVQVLNCVSLPFTSIVVALKQHLTPINAIDLEYTLSLSTACEAELLDEQFFNVDVAATSELDKTRARILKECEELQQDQSKELALLKAQEWDILERLQAYTRKKDWMTQFAHDPCGFMADVKKSQQTDQAILVAESELDEFTIPHPQQFTQPWLQMQAGARLRCDPTDYAKKQLEKKERAREIREQRARGVVSDQHTFSPKVNPPRRNSPPPSREESDESAKTSMSYRNYGGNNIESNGNDALDSLSRRYPKKAAPPQEKMAPLTQLEPEHDTLFREVKRATGREIEDLPIKRSVAPRAHTGPCLRNSSCGCPKCGGGGIVQSTTMSSNSSSGAPILRREPRGAPSKEPLASQLNSSRSMTSQNEMGNSLMLLKSKMSQRKTRSAPTHQASLFVEKSIPSSVVHSARAPSSTAMQSDTLSPPPRQPVAPRRAPSRGTAPGQPARKMPAQSNAAPDAGGIYMPTPITTGFNLSEQLDENENEAMEQCHNCNRKFNFTSFQKHQRICEKVFSGQRKVFNMTAKRLEGTDAEKLANEAKKAKGPNRKVPLSATEQPIKVKNTESWKQKSEMFRNAMKASRDVTQALKEGKELPPVMPSAPDPSLIQCEYCSRRFNEKAAERHINFCREKSQRDSIKASSKKAVVAKPGSRAASVRRR